MNVPNPMRRTIVTSLVGIMLSTLGVALLPAPGNAQSSGEHTVRVIIDYGDGVQKHFTALPWKKDMTILDAMNEAKASPHGITFQNTGSGSTAFLTKIDDLQNEGGGGKRNWI